MTDRVVVAHSGGIDSTVLLYDQLAASCDVVGFGIDYGQRHRRELEAAKTICADVGVPYHVANLDLWPNPDASGADPVIPGRNLILIAMAGAYAATVGASWVAIACHAGDYELFPDCRGVFLEEAFRALRRGCGVGLRYPYVRLTKLDVVRRGVELGVPFHRTWSCYVGGDQPCGDCLACRERREALFLAGVI